MPRMSHIRANPFQEKFGIQDQIHVLSRKPSPNANPSTGVTSAMSANREPTRRRMSRSVSGPMIPAPGFFSLTGACP